MNDKALYYGITSGWKKLPECAKYFLKLGMALTGYLSLDRRLILGLTVPTRAYAASLIATGITIQRTKQEIIPNQKKKDYWDVVPGAQFIKQLIGEVKIKEFITKTQHECIILGHVNNLEAEIQGETFAVISPDKNIAEGLLQDIIRARRFLKEGEGYRSEVFPVTLPEAPKIQNNETPLFVIFDGPIGFLKWRDYWQESNWILILDRTENVSSFFESASIINQRYIQKRLERDEKYNDLQPVPQGIELIIFEEKR